MTTTAFGFLTVIGALALGLGCASQSKDQNDKTQAPMSEQGMKNELSDAQVVAIVRTLNDGEVEAGELAKTMAKTEPVRDFANMMITDHTGANQKVSELSQRLGIVPADSDDTKKMKHDHQAMMDELRTKLGADFDHEYMTAMVEGHENALKAIDEKLLPNAKNMELAGLLREIRPKVAEHLARAKQLKDTAPVASN